MSSESILVLYVLNDEPHESAIAHLALCVANRDQCQLDLKNTFRKQ